MSRLIDAVDEALDRLAAEHSEKAELALFSQGSTVVVSDCRFIGNSAPNSFGTASGGGAIYSFMQATLDVTRCTFTDNTATSGGAISSYLSSTLNLRDCVINHNSATQEGGGIWQSGPFD
jgi:predicted outer membrane repeat protein